MKAPESVVLSPTRVAGALKCLRKHALSEMLGMVPASAEGESPALAFGDLMHRASALHWTAGAEVAREFLLSTFAEAYDSKHTPELAHRLLGIYAAEARLMPFGGDEWEIETVEQRLSLPVPFGTLTFQVDRLLRHKDEHSRRALVDLKTASRCDRRWEAQWPRSLQMRLYAECVARYYGAPLQWQIIEGLDKTTPRVVYLALPEVSEEKRAEAWHIVEWVARHDSELLDGATDEDGSVNLERLLELALTQTPTNEGECFTYGRPCQFLPLCDAEPSERIALLRSEYRYEQPKHLV